MKTSENEKTLILRDQKPPNQLHQSILQKIYPLSGKEIVDRILEQDNPRQLIQQLPQEDFFWLVKKVGDDDCLPLLELASEDQWQHLLDLEIWRKDRLNLEGTFCWLGRLRQADLRRLVRWLFSEGQGLAYYYLFRSIYVEIKNEDELYDLKEGFFTPDGLFHVRVLEKEHKETVETILQTMASEDFEQYQALLLGIAGLLPAEFEEEMYRLRNVRLAEHGFLPYDEALKVYAPLAPESIRVEEPAKRLNALFDEKTPEVVPILPLYHARRQNLLTQATLRITDNLVMDRIHLEFAGLCNQIISADGVMVNELDILIKTCRKAAGYLNITLERLCSSDISLAEKLLKSNHLVSIFRVGFGLVLELKWEAERWLKNSWFYGQGLDFSFWGDNWGETLAGIVQNKPCFFAGFTQGEAYKDFEQLSELNACRKLIHRLMILDDLLKQLAELYPLDKRIIQDPNLSFHPLLFNLWARQVLNLEPCFSGISAGQAKEFFHLLRAGDEKPPYRMPGFEETFIRDLVANTSDFEPEAVASLKDTLCLIWREFSEEYKWVFTENLDGRYSKHIWFNSSAKTPDSPIMS